MLVLLLPVRAFIATVAVRGFGAPVDYAVCAVDEDAGGELVLLVGPSSCE